MQKILEEERRRDLPRLPAVNSFHPLEARPHNMNEPVTLPRGKLIIPGEIDEKSLQETSCYLPCHYFDYIAGTSTGGFVHLNRLWPWH